MYGKVENCDNTVGITCGNVENTFVRHKIFSGSFFENGACMDELKGIWQGFEFVDYLVDYAGFWYGCSGCDGCRWE